MFLDEYLKEILDNTLTPHYTVANGNSLLEWTKVPKNIYTTIY